MIRNLVWALLFTLPFAACSSGPAVKSEAYAKMPDHRTFENDFPTVWKGIESALRNHKITDRNPTDVDGNEMRKLTHRDLETDWIYGRSDTKYIEYKVNGSPRKTWLQTRYRYQVEANSVMGGVDVKVRTDEEIEKLKADGTGDGYSAVDSPDPNRASLLIDRIGQAILSAPPVPIETN